MKTDILANAIALSDADLLAHLGALSKKECETTAELVGHLAALDMRPALYAAAGYGSLFDYCTEALGLSEDAACNRIDAARACRRFPEILDLLTSGAVTLTAVRLLRPHLTQENHQAVLARARHRRLKEIGLLIAELAPRPDVRASVRKLAAPKASSLPSLTASDSDRLPLGSAPPPSLDLSPSPQLDPLAPAPGTPLAADVFRTTTRPILQALAPHRYRVQFTIDEETHEDLRCVQALLRREIPNGDPGVIFKRALRLLRQQVERMKLGATSRPRVRRAIRSETDDAQSGRPIRPGNQASHDRHPSRHIPAAVKRQVWQRDRGQCAFVASTGHRCSEGVFLEFHHVQPYARGGPASVENIALRCWRHNHYEGELMFGPHGSSTAGESLAPYR